MFFFFFLPKKDGNLVVHVYDGDILYSELTISEFNREFTSLKMQYNQQKNSKIWEVLSENKKAIKGRDFSKNIGKEDATPNDCVDGKYILQNIKKRNKNKKKLEPKKINKHVNKN